jgi:hypothetical protein
MGSHDDNDQSGDDRQNVERSEDQQGAGRVDLAVAHQQATDNPLVGH